MNCLLELLFSAIVYLIQILSFVGIVFCLNRMISLINAKYSKARFIAIAIILFALIAKGTSDPVIICPNLYQNSFTQEKRIVAKDIPTEYLYSRCGLRSRTSNVMEQQQYPFIMDLYHA